MLCNSFSPSAKYYNTIIIILDEYYNSINKVVSAIGGVEMGNHILDAGTKARAHTINAHAEGSLALQLSNESFKYSWACMRLTDQLIGRPVPVEQKDEATENAPKEEEVPREDVDA